MAGRRGGRPSNRQILGAIALILALLALLNIGAGPWLTIAVILLALAQFI